MLQILILAPTDRPERTETLNNFDIPSFFARNVLYYGKAIYQQSACKGKTSRLRLFYIETGKALAAEPGTENRRYV